ncbi:MAG: ABC transporter substrate-binding protein [Proteobacteria bacterium]|nr:ABC transporter substrate-binding protein [Pseudomonadota bacterium]
MRKRLSFLVMIVALSLVAAACSSSGDDGTTTTADSGGGATTTAPADTPTTTAPADTPTTTAPADTGGEMKTGVGVDAENKVIKIGMLADLTGLFAPLVVDITDSQTAFWDNVNANGGLDGWTVEIVIEDTNYNVEQHIEKYEKIRNDVLALGQSTGSL